MPCYLTTILATLTLILPGALAAKQPSAPLWPAGEAPYYNAEIDSGRPKLIDYLADSEKRNGAAIVICPGGGYGGLAGDHEGHQIAQFFNDLGVSAFILHYRLGGKGYHYPAQLADVQRALRTVRHRASDPKLGIDPDRIGVIGFSAGGHLASMAATLFDRKAYDADKNDPIDQLSARPAFAVLCYPVISMIDGITHDGSRRNLSGDKAPDDHSAKVRSLSSEFNVPANAPPTFLFHTSEDTVVPAANSLRFYQALLDNQIPAELHIYQRGPHGVGLNRGDPAAGTWSDHLVTWLRNNGFFVEKAERSSVSGSVSLDGVPVSWGLITFSPDDPNQPVTSLRVRGGEFRADAASGPVIGKSAITFEASIWEETQKPNDRVIQTDRLSPNDVEPVSLIIEKPNDKNQDASDAAAEPLNFELESK